MKNYFLTFLFLLFLQKTIGQVNNQEQAPVFPECKNTLNKDLEQCFYNQLQDYVYHNFKLPKVVNEKEFEGKVITLFEVDTTGTFKVLFVDAMYPELIEESKRIFASLPKVEPATYNGKPTYAKFTLTTRIPLQSANEIRELQATEKLAQEEKLAYKKENPEYENIEKEYQKFDNPQFQSQLNIPFSHSYYSQFDASINQIGTNSHTASKPFSYAEVAKYYDFQSAYEKIKLNKSNWWGRKLFNENLVAIKSNNYWFTMNPVWDLRLGKANPQKENYTYTNTRALQIQGGLGKQIAFTTSIYESQGVFADYYNRYANSIKPSGGDPAIIPGIGISKDFKTTQYDFPSADANISFTPSKIFNLQLGYGRNFIGDGYRSIFEGDGASPYPFFKINTTFWKIKYTNTYMWLKDVRPDATNERTYATKYMANHYLSWNATKRLNIGFFESVIWANTNNRGFDINFVNPIIFYRSVEFSSSARSGNATLGLSGKYKWNNNVNFYSQFFIDEFAVGDMFGGEKSWRNKIGYQIGVKYYNAFKVKNLYLQVEYNRVRPYVYSHSDIITNYGHNNQNMGHNWGASFSEIVTIARYTKGRLFSDLKINYGIRGYDFEKTGNNSNFGNDIYRDYDAANERFADKGVLVGQGNTAKIVIADFNAGYLVNPSTNLKLFANFMYRSFSPKVDTATLFKENTTWISLGLRSDVFNWYFDY